MTGADGLPAVVAAAAAVCVLASAAVVLGHASPLAVLGVGVLAVVTVIALALRGVADLTVALLVLGVATSPWNAVALGAGLKLAHVLLALAVLLLAVQTLTERTPVRVPPWVWILGGTVTLSAVLSLVAPPSPGWFAARTVDDTQTHHVVIPSLDALGLAGLVEGAQWLVPLVAMPVALCLACSHRPRLTMWLADAWVAGTAISALVALTDEAKLTAISASLLPFVDIGGRQAGLSVQPNHIAVSVAIAAPLAVWRLARAGTGARMFAGVCLVVMAGGLVVSQSRGALVAAVLGIVVVLVGDPRARRAVLPVTAVAVALGAVVLATVPGALAGIGDRLRLTGAADTLDSDAVRASVAEQAVRDFFHSPWHGIGLEVLVQSHVIYLELLAAGGLLLLVGFAVGLGGSLVTVWRQRTFGEGLGLALGVCTATWLVVGFVENQLTDVFLYVPLALTAGLRATRVAQPVTEAASVPPLRVSELAPGGTR